MGRGPPYFVLPCSFSISGGVFCRKWKRGPPGTPGTGNPKPQHTAHSTHRTHTHNTQHRHAPRMQYAVACSIQYPVCSMNKRPSGPAAQSPASHLPPASSRWSSGPAHQSPGFSDFSVLRLGSSSQSQSPNNCELRALQALRRDIPHETCNQRGLGGLNAQRGACSTQHLAPRHYPLTRRSAAGRPGTCCSPRSGDTVCSEGAQWLRTGQFLGARVVVGVLGVFVRAPRGAGVEKREGVPQEAPGKQKPGVSSPVRLRFCPGISATPTPRSAATHHQYRGGAHTIGVNAHLDTFPETKVCGPWRSKSRAASDHEQV
jgi:hypothetical protein